MKVLGGLQSYKKHRASRQSFHFPTFISCLLLLLAACAPEATPFPAEFPTEPPATNVPTEPPQIRYALHPNSTGWVANLEAIRESAQVIQLSEPLDPNGLGAQYDLIAGYGEWSGWERTTVIPHAALLINPQAAPLDSPPVADLVRHSIDPQAIVTALAIPGVIADGADTQPASALFTQLANQGYPDGLTVTLAQAYVPGADELSAQFRAAGFDNTPVLLSEAAVGAGFDDGWLNLALVTWKTTAERDLWVARLGAENVIDLYALPISYRAQPELTITTTVDGWPLASW